MKYLAFGNVGTIASFRIGVSDANYIQHEFQPTFSESDLINIEKYHAYMKTLIGGEPTQPFSLDLTKNVVEEEAKKNPKVAELVRELSRLKFAKPKEIVEQEIAKRSRLFEFLGDAGPAALPGKEGGNWGGGNV